MNEHMTIHEICVSLEAIKDGIEDMTNEDLIDLTARVNGLRKNCEAIEEHTKFIVKAHCSEKQREMKGIMFKAIYTPISFDGVDVKRLKVEEPDIFEAYKKPIEQERVLYKTR